MRHSRTQKPPQGHSNGSRAPHGRSNGRSRLPFARPQTLHTLQNPPNPPNLQKSGQLRREKVPQQAQHAPLPHAKATTRPQQWLKGTPRPQQWLLTSYYFLYTRSRLPFARPQTLQTLQNPPNPPKVRPAPQGKGTPTSPTRATPARKSHHKATAMAQEHHTAAAMASFIGVQRCRLPGLKPSKPSAQHAPLSHAKATTRPQQWLKGTPRPQQWLLTSYTRSRLPFARPQTLQTLQNPPNPPKPSKPSKSPASSAGKRYPNKPNTRHSRTQKPPQGHSNGSRAPHGRSNGFFYRRSTLPFARPQTLQTLRPTCATLARKSHHKATAMAQEHPTAAAMASYRRSLWYFPVSNAIYGGYL